MRSMVEGHLRFIPGRNVANCGMCPSTTLRAVPLPQGGGIAAYFGDSTISIWRPSMRG